MPGQLLHFLIPAHNAAGRLGNDFVVTDWDSVTGPGHAGRSGRSVPIATKSE